MRWERPRLNLPPGTYLVAAYKPGDYIWHLGADEGLVYSVAAGPRVRVRPLDLVRRLLPRSRQRSNNCSHPGVLPSRPVQTGRRHHLPTSVSGSTA